MVKPVMVEFLESGEKRDIILRTSDYLPPGTVIIISLPTFREIQKAGSWQKAIIENKKIAVGIDIENAEASTNAS